MCTKDDYVNWDDIDLDSLLVEYTDNDFNVSTDFDSTSEHDSAAVQPEMPVADAPNTRRKVKAAATVVKSSYTYCCPACQRQYKSPSGLRGHVLKKHQDIYTSGSFKGKQFKLEFT